MGDLRELLALAYLAGLERVTIGGTVRPVTPPDGRVRLDNTGRPPFVPLPRPGSPRG
jgi:hypothetical protein